MYKGQGKNQQNRRETQEMNPNFYKDRQKKGLRGD